MFPATLCDVKYQISQNLAIIKKLRAFRVNENVNKNPAGMDNNSGNQKLKKCQVGSFRRAGVPWTSTRTRNADCTVIIVCNTI